MVYAESFSKINAAFRDLVKQNLIQLYIDDLIMPAANKQEELDYIRLAFKIASEYGLQINFKKCQVFDKVWHDGLLYKIK